MRFSNIIPLPLPSYQAPTSAPLTVSMYSARNRRRDALRLVCLCAWLCGVPAGFGYFFGQPEFVSVVGYSASAATTLASPNASLKSGTYTTSSYKTVNSLNYQFFPVNSEDQFSDHPALISSPADF